MKYEESNNSFRPETLRALEKIAMKASYALDVRGGIEGRGNDGEDFVELSIYSLQDMLERAYLLGKSEGQNGKER